MRHRYGKSVDANQISISQGIGGIPTLGRPFTERQGNRARLLAPIHRSNRKKLAQALNFLYRRLLVERDPRTLIDNLFPLSEAKQLIDNLVEGDPLEDVETKAIAATRKCWR